MRPKHNITVAIEASLLKKARAVAARRGRSVSALLADELRQLVADGRFERHGATCISFRTFPSSYFAANAATATLYLARPPRDIRQLPVSASVRRPLASLASQGLFLTTACLPPSAYCLLPSAFCPTAYCLLREAAPPARRRIAGAGI